MARDSRDANDELGAGSGGRNGNGRPAPSRGSRPSDPGRSRNTPPGSRSIGGFGPNGLIKPPLPGMDSGGRSKPPSNPRSRPGGPPSGNSHSNHNSSHTGNHTLARMHSPRGPRRPEDDESASMEAPEAPRPQRGSRSVGQMARDLSRNLSRSLSRSLHQIGTSFSRAVREAGTYERPGAPRPELPGDLQEQLLEQLPYRRSRARLVARKWRLARIGPNPIAYAIVVMLLLVAVVVVLGVGGAGGVYAATYYNSHQSQIQQIYNLRFSQGTQIYDRNGKLLYVAQADDTGLNIYVPLTHISDKVQWSSIETEDHTFWTNQGVDLYRTVGAAFADARSGSAQQGASTITQQLVKNIVAKDNNKTVTRKINEAILAYGVNLNYTKAQILEMYLNTLDFGDRNTGIETAARNYFGVQPTKDANGKDIMANEQLDWWQAAMLAGIPNAPGKYLPIQFSCDKGPCEDSKWDNPCLNNPHEPTCIPNPKYDYTPGEGGGHEWLVYRRSLVVLGGLENNGHITKQQHDDAAQKIHDCLVSQCVGHWLFFQAQGSTTASQDVVPKLAPNFVDYVLNQLVHDFGVTDPAHTALRVYTTLDYSLQDYAQKRVHYYVAEDNHIRWPQYCGRQGCDHPSLASQWNAHNGALVAVDPHTGDIMAMVGSVDYTDKSKQVAGQVNITTAPRSMGSATKALVYATAFQMGWNPGVTLQDQPVCYPVPALVDDPGQPDDKTPFQDPDAPACVGWYMPHNFTFDSFSGPAPIRVMLANSLNIPATEAQYFVGGTAVTAGGFLAMANRLGIDPHSLTAGRIGPSTALGTQEIPLIELTSAFGTFANAGKHAHTRAILRIDGPDGSPLYRAPDPQPQQAISPQAAYMLTSVLTDNQARAADFNTQSPLYFPDFAVAAKTGTSQGTQGPRDILTMGYTPYLAVGVWVGNSDSSDLKPGIIGIAGAGYVFADVIQWAHDNYKWPNVQFPIPPGMARGQFNCITGLAPYKDQGVQPCSLNMYKPGSTNLYCGWGCLTRVNEDWYIQGQQWLQS